MGAARLGVLAWLGLFRCGRPQESLLEPSVCRVRVGSEGGLASDLGMESLASGGSSAAPAKPAQVVSAPVEACGGHRRLPLFGRLGEIPSSGQVPIEDFVYDPRLEPLGIPVRQVQAVRAHDSAVLVLDLGDDPLLQRFYNSKLK